MTLRVLHLHSGNLFGGIETVLVTLARARGLVPEMEPTFALCFDGRLAAELVASGCPPHRLPAVRTSRPWTVWRARRALRALLVEHPADIVVCHAPWIHAVFAPAVRAAHVPLAFWQHGSADGRHWLERWAGRTLPDGVLSNSQFTVRSLPALFPGIPSAVVLYPVMAPPPVANAMRDTIRDGSATPRSSVVILQVSRMEAWKGHVALLDALARLGAPADWHCWIVGGAQRPAEQAYLESLRAAAAGLGIGHRVHFLGERTDVSAILAAADLFCQPNTTPEPFGIVFVEALYAALPIITTAMGGAVEIVDQTCGVVVPPHNTAALAEAIARLVSDAPARRRLGGAGPERAAQLCDPAQQLGRLATSLEVFARRRAP